MRAVAMPARGWDERGESLEELPGREGQRGAPVRQGSRWCVEQAGYFAVGPAQAVQGERRSGRVAQEAFEAGAVPRFEANRSVYREPSSVVPMAHLLGGVGLEPTAAFEAWEHAPTHRGFGGCHVGVAQAERFVEPDLSFGVWCKDPVDQQHVKVKMWIETVATASSQKQKIMGLIATDRLGIGDDELGRKLIISLIKTIGEMGDELWRLVRVNNGVKLTIDGSPVLEDLVAYENDGLTILVCGTCLTHFGLLEAKEVGDTTNMLDIVTAMQLADKVINL
jgi:selenium metabolism protein YedF